MTTLADLTQTNPDLPTQLANWRQAATQIHQDPYEWPAFRNFVRTEGSIDPGPVPPDDWLTPTVLSVATDPADLPQTTGAVQPGGAVPPAVQPT